LRRTWRFSLTLSASAIAGLALTQLDKLVLSKLLTLEQFGYYSLAALVASLLWALVTPVCTAYYPRLSRLAQDGDRRGLNNAYNSACRILATLLLPTALLLSFFSEDILLVWTGSRVTAESAHMLVSLLVLGNLIYGLAGVGNHLLVAVGHPGIALRANLWLALANVPILLFAVPRWGPIAGALTWIAVSCVYTFTVLPLMHRRLLQGQYVRSLLADTLAPGLAAFIVVYLSHSFVESDWAVSARLTFVVGVWLLAVGLAACAMPEIRRRVIRQAVVR
jgi:O-antigen/teichoic acid export membrane protein